METSYFDNCKPIPSHLLLFHRYNSTTLRVCQPQIGLVIAIPMAKYLQIPVVYARKERNVVMSDTYQASYSTKTVGTNRELLVSKSHLSSEDRILVIDDLLSSGSSQEALFRIISQSGAKPVGVGVLIEKGYESGRQFLSGFNIPVESMVRIASVQDQIIQLVEEEGYGI